MLLKFLTYSTYHVILSFPFRKGYIRCDNKYIKRDNATTGFITFEMTHFVTNKHLKRLLQCKTANRTHMQHRTTEYYSIRQISY